MIQRVGHRKARAATAVNARKVTCRPVETPVLRLVAGCVGTGRRFGTSFELGDMTAAVGNEL